jgi:peptidoglycan/LPS O-acetylase OafA/YrhL
MSLLDGERQATGRVDLRAFYIRRALRILPAFRVMLGVTCALCSCAS